MKPLLLFTLSVAVFGSVGCASRSPFAGWDDHDLADRVTTYRSSGELPSPPLAEEEAIPASADVTWYVTRALADNAELRSAHQRVERLRERIAQVQGLPDPMATITAGELAETAAGRVAYIVGVQQTLPFPGTLTGRAAVARREVDVALGEWDTIAQRIEGDLTRAYWSRFAATREIDVLTQSRSILEQINATVTARARVNKAGQDDLLRVSRRLAAIENRIASMRQRQQTAEAMLKRLISRRSTSPLPSPVADQPIKMQFDREVLLRSAMQSNAAVRVAQARVATYHARLDLARVERKPDFQLGVQYGAVRASGLSPVANGDDQAAATFGVTLPLWTEKYDAAEREAFRGMGETLADVQAAQDRVAFEVDDALARIDASRDILSRLRQRIMPDARQTIQVALSGYQNGSLDLLQLLDDWQALLDDQMDEARTIADLNRAVADLKQTLGSPLPNMLEDQS